VKIAIIIKKSHFQKNLKRENFEISSIYNLFSKEKLNMKLKEKIKEQNWTEEENKKLLESMKNNNNWDDIVKSLGKNNNKTKTDCILHLIQMPIIELNDDESDKEEKEINDTEKDQDKEKDNENIKEGNNVLITENEFLQINQEEDNSPNFFDLPSYFDYSNNMLVNSLFLEMNILLYSLHSIIATTFTATSSIFFVTFSLSNLSLKYGKRRIPLMIMKPRM